MYFMGYTVLVLMMFQYNDSLSSYRISIIKKNRNSYANDMTSSYWSPHPHPTPRMLLLLWYLIMFVYKHLGIYSL